MDIFLEENIAALQKAQKRLNHLKHHQEEDKVKAAPPPIFKFKEEICLKEQVKLPIIEDFFDYNAHTENFVMWRKQKGLVLAITLDDEVKEIPSLNEKVNQLSESFKENEFYFEFTRVEEKKSKDYVYQYIDIKLPTSIGSLIQVTIIVYHNDKSLEIVASYLEQSVKDLKKAIEYIIQHLIWEGEAVCGS